jgi:ubiquinone/menaquinone biosynthesis C-methylase UbiE
MPRDIIVQQQNVSDAFSRQAIVFDELDEKNLTLCWMRDRIRKHVLSYWKQGEHILELNAGTGLDAVFFAQQGFYVHATDNAPGMLAALKQKVNKLGLNDRVTSEQCSFLNLNKIQANYNHIFSNFGGLNCTEKLEEVIHSFSSLIKPEGTATLVIMPPVCPWEMLLAFKGNFKIAFRRLKKNGTPSHLEGLHFNSYYYTPTKVKNMFGKKYKSLSVKGLASFVPPPFLETFPIKHPGTFKTLTHLEDTLAGTWPFNTWADHFIITMQKCS